MSVPRYAPVQHESAFCCSAQLRGAVRPEWAPFTEVPYTSLLKNGRVIHDEVVRVPDKSITLRNSAAPVAFDFLIVGERRFRAHLRSVR